MIVASGIALRAGARLLLADASFQVAEGDRIGLVGRNGAGKTTLAKVLSGNGQPAAGTVRRSGTVGYLPQDPRTGDLDVLALDRVLSARGLDELRGVRDVGDALEIGAMTTHYELTRNPLVKEHCGLLAETAALIADPAVRHRGTLGGVARRAHRRRHGRRL